MIILQECLEAHMINMKSHVEGRKAGWLAFNIDEIGSSD
jgi:hypothetical protein